jgi:hypothetical protein
MRRRNFVALITGAAFAWLVAARAQQPMPVIGYLSSRSPEFENIPARLIAFRRGLNETGYVGQAIPKGGIIKKWRGAFNPTPQFKSYRA